MHLYICYKLRNIHEYIIYKTLVEKGKKKEGLEKNYMYQIAKLFVTKLIDSFYSFWKTN